jgi:hypothetical protein
MTKIPAWVCIPPYKNIKITHSLGIGIYTSLLHLLQREKAGMRGI